MGREEYYYSLTELSLKLNIGTEKLSKYIKNGHFPNAFKLPPHKGGWQIPESDIQIFLESNPNIQKLINDIKTFEESREKYLSAEQIAKRLNKDINTIWKFLQDGVFPNTLRLPSIKVVGKPPSPM